jgi:hypothetical protein
MSNTKTNTDVSARAFLNYAREYHQASEQVFQAKSLLSRPLNALYFHTVELALKAYLRAHGRDPWGHKIQSLYDECRALGLKVSADDRFGLVNLLESGNVDMGFRYFSFKSVCEPNISWTREFVGQLVEAVGTYVDLVEGPSAQGLPVKLTIIFGKPVRKRVTI